MAYTAMMDTPFRDTGIMTWIAPPSKAIMLGAFCKIRDGTFRVGTDKGLQLLDPENFQITLLLIRHMILDQKVVLELPLRIPEDTCGSLPIMAYSSDKDRKLYKRLREKSESEDGIFGKTIRCIFEDADGMIWVGSRNPWENERGATILGGLSCYDIKDKRFFNFLVTEDREQNDRNYVQMHTKI